MCVTGLCETDPINRSNPYYLYIIQPFPVQQHRFYQDFIFVDVIRQGYGKTNYPGLHSCLNLIKLPMYAKKPYHL